MAVRRVELERSKTEPVSAGTAIQAALLALTLLLSPLFYDLWRMFGGS